MDVRDLRCFLAVAEARSFTRAAERLGMAQPPLSRRIAELETALGATLLRRGQRPLVLTKAGRFLQEQAREILAQIESAEAGTRRVGAGARRILGVGFVGSALYGALPLAIRRFHDTHPDVEVSLSELTTDQQREALRLRRIDVGFGRLDLGEDAEITRRVLFWEQLVCACASDHPFTALDHVTLADIAGERLIIYPGQPRPSYADQVLAIFRAAELAPHVALETRELQTAIGLAAAGLGVTLVPASVQRLRRDDLLYVPIADDSARSPVIVSHRRKDRSALLQTFLALTTPASTLAACRTGLAPADAPCISPSFDLRSRVGGHKSTP